MKSYSLFVTITLLVMTAFFGNAWAEDSSPPRMLRTSSGNMVPLVSPEYLQYELFERGAITLRISTTLDFLAGRTDWPAGYREVIERYVLKPEEAKLGSFSHRDYSAAVNALYAQMKIRGETIPDAVRDKIVVSRILDKLSEGDRNPAVQTGLKIEKKIAEDPIFLQSLRSTIDRPNSEMQNRRLAKLLREHVITELKAKHTPYSHSLEDLFLIIRQYDFKGDDINAIFVENLTSGRSNNFTSFFRETILPDREGNPSAVLLDPGVQRAIGNSNFDVSGITGWWTTMNQGNASAFVRFIRRLPGFRESAPLQRFVGRLASEYYLDTFKESVGTLGEITPEVRAAMADPQKANWIVESRVDLVDRAFPEMQFVRQRAGWQIDSDRFASLLRSRRFDSIDILVLTKQLEPVFEDRSLSPAVSAHWLKFVEENLAGGTSPEAKKALVQSVRQLKIWSPQIESTLISWISEAKLEKQNPNHRFNMQAVQEAVGAINDAQVRGQFSIESERKFLGAIGDPARRLTAMMKVPFAEAFYGPFTSTDRPLVHDWLRVVGEMRDGEVAEAEMMKILNAFKASQFKRKHTGKEEIFVPFELDEKTVQKTFEVVGNRESVSPAFREFLVSLFEDPKMRRALYEYAPGIVSKHDLPMTAAMRSEIDRLRSGKELRATDQLAFYRPSQTATLEGFFASLMQPSGPLAPVHTLPKEPAAIFDEVTQSTPTGAIRLFPVENTKSPGKKLTDTSTQSKLDELRRIEKWTDALMGESGFDRNLFPNGMTEGQIAVARIEGRLSALKSDERLRLIERIFSSDASVLRDVDRERLSAVVVKQAVDMPIGQKAELANWLLQRTAGAENKYREFVGELIFQVANESKAGREVSVTGLLKNQADFRIAAAMHLVANGSEARPHFFDLLEATDLRLSKSRYGEISELMNARILNETEREVLKRELTKDFASTLRRADFLQRGPERARAALALIGLADASDESLQAALNARRGRVSNLFFGTLPTEIPASPSGSASSLLNRLKTVWSGCPEGFSALKKSASP